MVHSYLNFFTFKTWNHKIGLSNHHLGCRDLPQNCWLVFSSLWTDLLVILVSNASMLSLCLNEWSVFEYCHCNHVYMVDLNPAFSRYVNLWIFYKYFLNLGIAFFFAFHADRYNCGPSTNWDWIRRGRLLSHSPLVGTSMLPILFCGYHYEGQCTCSGQLQKICLLL